MAYSFRVTKKSYLCSSKTNHLYIELPFFLHKEVKNAFLINLIIANLLYSSQANLNANSINTHDLSKWVHTHSQASRLLLTTRQSLSTLQMRCADACIVLSEIQLFDSWYSLTLSIKLSMDTMGWVATSHPPHYLIGELYGWG